MTLRFIMPALMSVFHRSSWEKSTFVRVLNRASSMNASTSGSVFPSRRAW